MDCDRVGLICGTGDLPIIVRNSLLQQKIFHVVVAFEETVLARLKSLSVNDEAPMLKIKIGTIEPILNFFKQWDIQTVVMVGGIRRPKISDLSLDWLGLKWLNNIKHAFFRGDDALLRAVVGLLEQQGLRVESADRYCHQLRSIKE